MFVSKKYFSPLLIILAVTIHTSAVGAPREWTWHATPDRSHPDAEEQHLMWLMNRARSNPEAEGKWLADTDHDEIAPARRQYKVGLRRLRRQFRKLKPAPPAAFDVRLYNAALIHSNRMVDRDKQTHRKQMKDVERSGLAWSTCRGSVFAYASSALNAHAAFNIDWGRNWGGTQRGVGHRVAHMAAKVPLELVGIAMLREENTRTKVGPWVVTANYCSPRVDDGVKETPMLVGTVYYDFNANGVFDPGEGLPDIKVTPIPGDWFARTSAGGGFAVPLKPGQRTQVTMSGPNMDAVRYRVDPVRKNVLLNHMIQRQ